MTRKVTVASSAANRAKAFETNARTWGDLRHEISANGLSLDGVEAILKPGNVTLTREDAELPANEDFKIYLVPTKNKAGITDAEANSIANELIAAIKKAAQMASKKQLEDLKESLIGDVESFFEVDFDDEEGDDYDFEADFNGTTQHGKVNTREEDAALEEARRMAR